MEEEDSYLLSSNGFLCGAENYPLCKAMVNHDQERVKARGSREVGDEVTRDLLEGARGMGLNWGKQKNGGVCVRLILLAYGTALNVLAHKMCKAGPPEFSSNKLGGFEVTEVSSSLVVMTAGEDGVMKGVIQRNVDMAFVCEDMVVIFPVREARLERGGDILQG